MNEQNKAIILGIVAFIVAAAIIIVGVRVQDKKKNTVDIPTNYGEIPVDEDGEEVLGDLEHSLFDENGIIDKEYGTFSGQEAEKGKFNNKFTTFIAEKELDETVINKKNLYVLSKKDEEPSLILDYSINFIADHLTDGATQSLQSWFGENNDVFINLRSTVYTDIMLNFFPMKDEDCDPEFCTDVSLDPDALRKSLGLLVDNAESIGKELGEKCDTVYIYRNGEPYVVDGVTTESGQFIKQ